MGMISADSAAAASTPNTMTPDTLDRMARITTSPVQPGRRAMQKVDRIIAVYAYSSIGGQEQIRLRSPYGLSIRPTLGQCLFARTNGSGNAACSREYGCGQSDGGHRAGGVRRVLQDVVLADRPCRR